ncbi:MAG: AI-2E family transporter [Thermodesulfovibrionales bacterium]
MILFLTILFGYLSYLVIKPFLVPIAWAVVIAVLFYPLYGLILGYIKWRSVSAMIVLCIILLFIIGPISYLSTVLIQELKGLMDFAEAEKRQAIKNITGHPVVHAIIEKIISLFGITEDELNKAVMDKIKLLGKEMIDGIVKKIKDVITGIFNFLFMLLTIFFLLRDGPGFLKKIRHYMPFPEEHKDSLVKQIQDIVISTMYGGVVVALVQGAMGGFAFMIVGISSPVIWGLAMAIASFLPVIGPFIIWMPASVYLIVEGELLKGIALVLMGALGISVIDNILRPVIIGSRTKMHFLALFFSVMGGIKIFGLIGFVLGPLVLAMFVSVIEIFRTTEESGKA